MGELQQFKSDLLKYLDESRDRFRQDYLNDNIPYDDFLTIETELNEIHNYVLTR